MRVPFVLANLKASTMRLRSASVGLVQRQRHRQPLAEMPRIVDGCELMLLVGGTTTSVENLLQDCIILIPIRHDDGSFFRSILIFRHVEPKSLVEVVK